MPSSGRAGYGYGGVGVASVYRMTPPGVGGAGGGGGVADMGGLGPPPPMPETLWDTNSWAAGGAQGGIR